MTPISKFTRAAIAAERGEERCAGEWQPISTAPEDRDIPCLSPEYDGPIILRWVHYNGVYAWRDWDNDIHHPTHWFDLPPMPTLTTSAA